MMKKTILSVFLTVLVSAACMASVTGTINFQGVLKNSSGAMISGDNSMTFAIYDAASGGTSLWTETQTVTATDGLYSVKLGAASSIPVSVFNGSTRYLGVKVGSDSEMTPRVALVSVPYALAAGSVTAETSSGFGIYSVNKSTNAADAALLAKADNSNGIAIQGVALGSDSTAGWFFNTGSGAPTGVTGMATNATNTGYGVYGFNASSSGSGVTAANSSDSGCALTVNTLMKLTPRVSPPASPSEGMIYADTDHHLYYYNGTVWKQLDN